MPQDDIRRLPSDPRQLDKVFHSGRYRAVVATDHRGCHPDQRPGLGPEESSWPDEPLYFVQFRLGERRGIRVASEERRRHGVDALIGALSGEDRRHQELERIPERQFRERRRVLPLES